MPPSTIVIPTWLALVGALLGPLVALWAILRWLLWPRIETIIGGQVDKAFAPLRDDVERGVGRIAAALEQVAKEVAEHGKVQAATGAAVEILLSDRRSGTDRRHGS